MFSHLSLSALPWRRRSLTGVSVGWLALSTSILSGSTFNAFAKSLTGALTPLSLVFISEILVLFFLLLSFGLVPILKTYRSLERWQLGKLLILGIFSGVLGPGLWFTGLSFTTAVNASFFGKSELLFILLISSLFIGERLTKAHILAACSIVAGLTIISLRGLTELPRPELGDLLIVLAAFSFALGNSIYSKYLHHVPSHIALFSRSLTAVTAFLMISPFLSHSIVAEVTFFPGFLIPALLGFGFISRFVNSVAFYEAIERLPMSTISLVGSLDVVFATAVAFAMLGEPIAWYHFLGGAFVILGTLLLELLHKAPTPHAAEQRQLRQRVP